MKNIFCVYSISRWSGFVNIDKKSYDIYNNIYIYIKLNLKYIVNA